jgi:hypothetical protein
MPNYSYSGNEYTDKNNYVDETDADDINDLQDEVEIVEGVLTGGTDGQVLTADAEGKANWEDASGGGGGAGYEIVVATDWSADDDNIWVDLIDQTDLATPTIPEGGELNLCFSLVEVDESGNHNDFAFVQMNFNSGGHYSTFFENLSGLASPFMSMPSIGVTVIANFVHSRYYVEE